MLPFYTLIFVFAFVTLVSLFISIPASLFYPILLLLLLTLIAEYKLFMYFLFYAVLYLCCELYPYSPFFIKSDEFLIRFEIVFEFDLEDGFPDPYPGLISFFRLLVFKIQWWRLLL